MLRMMVAMAGFSAMRNILDVIRDVALLAHDITK